MKSSAVKIARVLEGEAEKLRRLNALFAVCFEDAESYPSPGPDAAYLSAVLRKEHIIVLVAEADDVMVGGLVAYELEKFEQKRREIYIYDLAVAEAYRQKGIATRLIACLREIAVKRGAWVVYVQADLGNDPAINLYAKLGRREEVLHFDIDPEDRDGH